MRLPLLVFCIALLAGAATVLALLLGRIGLDLALNIGMLLACLSWMFFLVKIPWDLYFSARKARIDGEESQRQGIEGVGDKTRLLAKMEAALLWAALAAHALTAVFVYALAVFQPELVQPGFSLLFILSVALRPAWEGYGYLRKRLSELASQVRYPRQDIQLVQLRLAELKNSYDMLERALDLAQKNSETRLQQLDFAQKQLQSQHISDNAQLEKRLVQLSHRFEEVIEKMSSDQDLLAGVRAFARMLRQPD